MDRTQNHFTSKELQITMIQLIYITFTIFQIEQGQISSSKHCAMFCWKAIYPELKFVLWPFYSLPTSAHFITSIFSVLLTMPSDFCPCLLNNEMHIHMLLTSTTQFLFVFSAYYQVEHLLSSNDSLHKSQKSFYSLSRLKKILKYAKYLYLKYMRHEFLLK